MTASSIPVVPAGDGGPPAADSELELSDGQLVLLAYYCGGTGGSPGEDLFLWLHTIITFFSTNMIKYIKIYV